MIEALGDWFTGLGSRYGVDPFVFGAIYVGAIPFLFGSIGWMVRRMRRGRPVTLQVLLAGFFFLSSYLYLLLAGKNLPYWVYALIIGLVTYGAIAAFRRVRAQAAAIDEHAGQG